MHRNNAKTKARAAVQIASADRHFVIFLHLNMGEETAYPVAGIAVITSDIQELAPLYLGYHNSCFNFLVLYVYKQGVYKLPDIKYSLLVDNRQLKAFSVERMVIVLASGFRMVVF